MVYKPGGTICGNWCHVNMNLTAADSPIRPDRQTDTGRCHKKKFHRIRPDRFSRRPDQVGDTGQRGLLAGIDNPADSFFINAEITLQHQ